MLRKELFIDTLLKLSYMLKFHCTDFDEFFTGILGKYNLEPRMRWMKIILELFRETNSL